MFLKEKFRQAVLEALAGEEGTMSPAESVWEEVKRDPDLSQATLEEVNEMLDELKAKGMTNFTSRKLWFLVG